tara:strand:+ start:4687 stop:5280 length:594 start_codon:yes stop_codon:yes gene_type:complete
MSKIDKSGNLILVDCDGVLVDWLYSFNMWMENRGNYAVEGVSEYDLTKTYGLDASVMKEYIRSFNQSATMCCLPPLRDSVKYVKKIHEELGYVFHCITSLSLDQHAGMLRKMNLENLFGKTVFEKIVCLDTGADKDDALLPYLDSGCMWVEDKPSNAELGAKMGLNAVLMQHNFSDNFSHSEVNRVKNWKEIYEMLV